MSEKTPATNDPVDVPDDMTRAEYAETLPGFVARSRKAFIAGLAAFAGAAAPATIAVTNDGVVTWEEVTVAGIACIGVGLSVFWATWATPNATA